MKARHEFSTEEAWLEYLRFYYAGQAMQGLLVNFNFHGHYANTSEYPMVDRIAVMTADALIKSLNENKEG